MGMPELKAVAAAQAAAGTEHDALVVVGPASAFEDVQVAKAAVAARRAIDAKMEDDVVLQPAPEVAGGRLILAPTGPLLRDQDDARRYADAAGKGVARALAAGAKRPTLAVVGVPSHPDYQRAVEVALLGALQELWQPLEAREAKGEGEVEPLEALGLYSPDGSTADHVVHAARALETGRRLARDVGGTQPERMTPAAMAALCETAFAGTPVKVQVLEDRAQIEEGYPLLAAVARCSQAVERHRPRVIRLEYAPDGAVERTLMFAGKGLVYDTGGADIKAGGHMAGMSRDKGGGAAVIGFLRAVAELKPRGVRVVALIGAVRNSVGSDAYVSDEIITSRAGVRVRVGNTDAEGRLVLADILAQLREEAETAPDPTLFTVATLTGHAVRAVGPYSIALPNGPARDRGVAQRLQDVGGRWGDPFEISSLRREDFDFIRPRSKADDVLSCNNAPSTMTDRGHQFPAAFLIRAAGLEDFGRDAKRPLPYVHVDVAGSATEGGDWQHGRPTGAPVCAFAAALLGDQ